MSKSYERVGENNKKYGQSTTIFSITERKTSIQILLQYERRREPKRERKTKSEQNNMRKVITHEDENFGNSQEELQKFVQEQKNVK